MIAGYSAMHITKQYKGAHVHFVIKKGSKFVPLSLSTHLTTLSAGGWPWLSKSEEEDSRLVHYTFALLLCSRGWPSDAATAERNQMPGNIREAKENPPRE